MHASRSVPQHSIFANINVGPSFVDARVAHCLLITLRRAPRLQTHPLNCALFILHNCVWLPELVRCCGASGDAGWDCLEVLSPQLHLAHSALLDVLVVCRRDAGLRSLRGLRVVSRLPDDCVRALATDPGTAMPSQHPSSHSLSHQEPLHALHHHFFLVLTPVPHQGLRAIGDGFQCGMFGIVCVFPDRHRPPPRSPTTTLAHAGVMKSLNDLRLLTAGSLLDEFGDPQTLELLIRLLTRIAIVQPDAAIGFARLFPPEDLGHQVFRTLKVWPFEVFSALCLLAFYVQPTSHDVLLYTDQVARCLRC